MFMLFSIPFNRRVKKNAFDVRIEFNSVVYKPEYEELENAKTKTLACQTNRGCCKCYFLATWRQHFVTLLYS